VQEVDESLHASSELRINGAMFLLPIRLRDKHRNSVTSYPVESAYQSIRIIQILLEESCLVSKFWS